MGMMREALQASQKAIESIKKQREGAEKQVELLKTSSAKLMSLTMASVKFLTAKDSDNVVGTALFGQLDDWRADAAGFSLHAQGNRSLGESWASDWICISCNQRIEELPVRRTPRPFSSVGALL